MLANKLTCTAVLISLTWGCSSPDDTHDSATAGRAGASTAPGGLAGSANSGGGNANGGNGTSTGGSPGGSVGMPQAGTSASGAPAAGGSAGGPPMPDPVGGTPEAKWVNVTGNLAGMTSECGNLGRVDADPQVDLLIVGVAQKGLFGSTDGGASWKPLGAGGDVITNRISYIAYDPSSPKTFWESGIYNGGGVYKTTDGGATFKRAGDVAHCDSVSVDFSDPARMTLLAGSHEQAQKLFRSTDGGATWKDIGMALPAGTGFCTTSTILDSKTFLVGCGGWYGGTPGIYRTTDGGTQFTKVSDLGVAEQPLRASDGSIYWAGHQQGGLYKSTDQGQHFAQAADPTKSRALAPIELPDGRLVTVGATTLMASADHGMTWTPLGDPLPFMANGVTYSAFRNAFFVWQWDCKNTVLPNAIMRFGYDYRK